MHNSESTSEPLTGRGRLVVATAGLLALLSASCCVLPIGLSIIGLGGSWLTMLGPFVAYRTELLILVGLILGWSWVRLWTRWDCLSRRPSTLVVLVLATMAAALAASSSLWEDDAARAMFALWRETRP